MNPTPPRRQHRLRMTLCLGLFLPVAAGAPSTGRSYLYAAQSAASRPPVVHSELRAKLSGLGRDTQVKAWVFFEDKDLRTPLRRAAALDSARRGLHARTMSRRLLRRAWPGLVDDHDIPVAVRYVDAVRAAGARVHTISKWLNAVSVRADAAAIEKLAALPFVRAIESVRGGHPRRPDTVGQLDRERARGGSVAGTIHGLAEAQLAQINLTALHASGFTGAGVVIGVLDTGFERTHSVFNEPGHSLQVVAEWDFISGDGNTGIDAGDPSGQHRHGTQVLSIMAGYAPGLYVGAAPDAAYILCKTEDTTGETPIEEDNYVAGLEFIEANGGDVATASLNYLIFYEPNEFDGRTAVTTRAVNIATANGLICCNSASNGGNDFDPGTWSIGAPADALQVITVGAVTIDGFTATFSSDGPSADGRVKPEVMANGVATVVANPGGAGFLSGSGTSFAVPIVAGAVACLVQAHPDWTVDQMRTYLFQNADVYTSTGAPDPWFRNGYGIVDALATAEGDCNGNGIDDALDIADGTSPDCDANGVPDECLTPDCNRNGVPDACDLADGTLTDTDGDFQPDQCCGATPPAPAEAAVAMNRFLEFRMTEPVGLHAVRVTLEDLPAPFDVLNRLSLWAGSPRPVSLLPGRSDATPPVFWAAQLQCEPRLADWHSFGTVRLFHDAIVPGGVYRIQQIKIGCTATNESNFSAPLLVANARWGDVVGPFDEAAQAWTGPDGSVDVGSDVVSILDMFADVPTAPPKFRVDLEPGTLDLIINITDVTTALDAFSGRPYPFLPPVVSCP